MSTPCYETLKKFIPDHELKASRPIKTARLRTT